MQIFKFGGASVKDAQGVKNLAHVLTTVGYSNTLIVVSAMGKTTNAMETVIANYFDAKHQLQSSFKTLRNFTITFSSIYLRTKNIPYLKQLMLCFKKLCCFLIITNRPITTLYMTKLLGLES